MRYPGFVTEVALPANRRKLRLSIVTGAGSVVLIGALALLGHWLGFLPHIWPVLAFALFKLATNTLSWLSLKYDRYVLETGGLNVAADLLTMTGLVYITGGPSSPLFAIYGIEVSVVALLTNRGTTLVVAGLAFALYGAMVVLVYAGILPSMPTPGASLEGSKLGYMLMSLALVAVVLGVPTLYTAAILRVLHEKQRALEDTNRALLEASRQKSQFMANITHELRTPIHGICGLSDLVEVGVYGPVTEKQRVAQQRIKQSARSLLQLIDDLLVLARADAGKLSYAPTEVTLSELMPTLAATTRWMHGTSQRHVELELEPGLPVLFTDRGKLNQILLNLLLNAVKFTGEGGHITLRVRRMGAHTVAFEVQDDGEGIPQDELEHIFEPFHQVDGSAERQYGGAGLGLALVQQLATMLGGEVRVTSELGKGSLFKVTLPLRHEERPAVEETGPSGAPTRKLRRVAPQPH